MSDSLVASAIKDILKSVGIVAVVFPILAIGAMFLFFWWHDPRPMYVDEMAGYVHMEDPAPEHEDDIRRFLDTYEDYKKNSKKPLRKHVEQRVQDLCPVMQKFKENQPKSAQIPRIEIFLQATCKK